MSRLVFIFRMDSVMQNATPEKKARSAAASIFLLAGAGVTLSLVLVYFVGLHAVRSNRAIASRRETIESLNALISSVKDAETGQRGYLLTRDTRYLDPYRRALASLRTQEADLLAEAKIGRLPRADAEALIGLVDDKLDELDETIQVARTRGQPAAVALVRSGQGKAAMEKIRARADGIRAALDGDLERMIDLANVAVVLRSAAFVIIGLFNLAFLAFLYRRIRHETREREATVVEHVRAREVLETTLTSIGDGVVVTDSQGRVRFLNPEATGLTGWSSDDARGHPVAEVFHIINERTRKEAPNPVERALREGRAVGLANHTLLVRKDGREVPIDDSAAPIHLADGTVHGVVLVFRDVTERRAAEESAGRLAGILTTSSDAILSKNLDGVIQTWNLGAEKIFGYRSEEIVGKHISVVVPPDRMKEEESILLRLREGRASELIDTVRLTKDGRSIHVSASVWPTRDHDGAVIGAAATYRDITERKRAEEAAARLGAILTTSSDAIVSKDLNGVIQMWNRGAERLFGYKAAEIIGKPMTAIVPPEKLPEEAEILRRLHEGLPFEERDSVRLTKDGRRLHVSVSVWPVRDAENHVIGAASTLHDITEHREQSARLEATVAARTAALQATIAELEAFTYTVAHDLRAPLRGVHRYSELLLEKFRDLPQEARDHLRNVNAGAKKMDRLIQDLLGYSKIGLSDPPRAPVDVAAAVKETAAALAAQIQESGAEVEISLEDIPPALGDRVLLGQVLENLLSNALKFVAPGRKPKIEIGAHARDGHIVVWVRDNGIGIEPRYHDRLFKLFERLHGRDRYPGTGIGLAIVRKAAEKMGGSVGFDSEPGTGSRFWLELPAAPS